MKLPTAYAIHHYLEHCYVAQDYIYLVTFGKLPGIIVLNTFQPQPFLFSFQDQMAQILIILSAVVAQFPEFPGKLIYLFVFFLSLV
jgi:hypothetical protein